MSFPKQSRRQSKLTRAVQFEHLPCEARFHQEIIVVCLFVCVCVFLETDDVGSRVICLR